MGKISAPSVIKKLGTYKVVIGNKGDLIFLDSNYNLIKNPYSMYTNLYANSELIHMPQETDKVSISQANNLLIVNTKCIINMDSISMIDYNLDNIYDSYIVIYFGSENYIKQFRPMNKENIKEIVKIYVEYCQSKVPITADYKDI